MKPSAKAPIRAILALPVLLAANMTLAQDKAPSFSSIDWKDGPCVGKLGNVAQLTVPAGFIFAESAGAKTFLELTQNIPSGDELGVLLPAEEGASWFVLFDFREVGYVTDTDRNKLDAAALLASIKKGTAAANEIRRKKGWPTMEIVGWTRPPFYDPKTNNLTWAIEGRSTPPAGASTEKKSSTSVNYSTRLLARKGYMEVELVLDPGELQQTLPQFSSVLNNVAFTSGNRYAEFRQGDKLAGYGLTALVAGGAGALAAKSGLLAKFWKLIVGIFIAIAAFFKRIWDAITGRNRNGPPTGGSPVQPG